jgi:hypothetical protein
MPTADCPGIHVNILVRGSAAPVVSQALEDGLRDGGKGREEA